MREMKNLKRFFLQVLPQHGYPGRERVNGSEYIDISLLKALVEVRTDLRSAGVPLRGYP